MERNQIGDLKVTALKSLVPQFARSEIPIPGSLEKFGLGFAINTRPVERGRASGSLAWAGVYNTFFWIDPSRKITAVLMMQLLPFLDDAPKTLLEQFEAAVYGSVAGKESSASGPVRHEEGWFDPRRTRDDYVPTGFKPYGARTYAVKGHPFGLELSDEDRKALIAFLKTL